MLVGVPLAAESGARTGWFGLVVPAAHLGVSTVLRRARGLPTPASSVTSVVQASVVGMATGGYLRRVHRRFAAERAAEAEAYAEAAGLAAQRDVAMAVGSLVDQVSGVEYLAAVAGGYPVGPSRSLARWKAALAEVATSDATYLRVAFSRWEQARRTNTLSADVAIDLEEASGSIVLTRSQADQLVEALDALALRGPCLIRAIVDVVPRVTGQELTIEVGPYLVTMAADGGPHRRIDPGPAMVGVGAGWVLAMSSSGHGRVPFAVTGGGAAASVALALWLAQASDRGAPWSPSGIAAAAVAVATLQALAAGWTLRETVDRDGVQVIPAAMTLMAPAFVAGRYHRAPDAPDVRVLVALFSASLLVSVIPLRGRVNPAHLAAGIGELVAAYLMFSRVQLGLDEEQVETNARYDDRRRSDALAAYGLGRQRVFDLVAAETDRLRQTLDVEACPGDLRDEICRRLDAVTAELEGLR